TTSMHFRNMFKKPVDGAKPYTGRIINGQVAEPHSIPFQAFLEVYSWISGWYCGGSLITSTVILTAGHCGFEAEEAHIVLGAQRPQENENTQVRVTSTNIVVHERFDMDKILNDIALIILPNAVRTNEYIQIVPLPSRSDVGNTYEGEIGKVSGWGLTDGHGDTISDVLRYVENPIISNRECNQIYGVVEDYQMCMSGDGGRSSCSGDSGGPFTVDGVQVGVVSYGVENCEGGYPSAFTRTTSFLDWIEQNS
ncbi:Trypsin domain containing protein, partial [Asbolus verrucosus]